MSNTAVVPTVDTDLMLVGYLNGDPNARGEFPLQVFPLLRRVAQHSAPDLDADIRQEIVQQVHFILLRRDPDAFDPERGTARAYLSLVTRQAAREVRASYTPPHEHTRLQKGKEGETLPQVRVSLDGLEAPKAESLLKDATRDATNAIEAVERRVFAEQLLDLANDTAPSEVSRALKFVYYQGKTFEEAARAVGLTRYQLRRKTKRWVAEQKLERIA